MNAVVVGGGLAGIAAALELADRGADVTLLEARPRLGGATFSIERDGLSMDNGQHVFLRCCTAYIGFLQRLGVADQVHLQRRLELPVLAPGGRAAWLCRSSLPAPLHLSGSLARYRLLSPRERLAAVRAALALRALDLSDPALDERTFGDWLAEHGQSPRAIEVFWDLIVLPTVNLRSADASLALATKVFQTGLLEANAAADIGWAAVPLGRLHGKAAERALAAAGVDVRLRAPVESLTEVAADAVVLAVPHREAGELLGRPELAALGASPIVNLHVVYDRKVTDLPIAAGVDTPVQFVFDRTGSSGLRRGQYLAVSLSAAYAFDRRRVDDLRAAFLPELARLFPAAARAEVRDFFVTREPTATFRQAPGTQKLRSPRAELPNVYVAGAWTDTGWPATMEGAVRSGVAAARAALASDVPAEVAA